MRNEFDIINDPQTIDLIIEIKEILEDFGYTIEERRNDSKVITYSIHKINN